MLAKKAVKKIIEFIFENKIEEMAIVSTLNLPYSKEDYFEVMLAIKEKKKEFLKENKFFTHFIFNFFNKQFFLLFNTKNDFFKPVPKMSFGASIPTHTYFYFTQP